MLRLCIKNNLIISNFKLSRLSDETFAVIRVSIVLLARCALLRCFVNIVNSNLSKIHRTGMFAERWNKAQRTNNTIET